jgi:hypothetical protein
MEVATPLSSRYIKRSGHVERISSSNSPRRFPLPSVSRSVAWSDFFSDAIRVALTAATSARRRTAHLYQVTVAVSIKPE